MARDGCGLRLSHRPRIEAEVWYEEGSDGSGVISETPQPNACLVYLHNLCRTLGTTSRI